MIPFSALGPPAALGGIKAIVARMVKIVKHWTKMSDAGILPDVVCLRPLPPCVRLGSPQAAGRQDPKWRYPTGGSYSFPSCRV